ncbi:uncharacterized protein LOC120330066 [Styela clava]
MFVLEKIMYISLLMIVLSFDFIKTERCRIPEENEEIDIDKSPNTWYMVLHTNDPVMGKDVSGSRLHNFTKTSTGLNMVATEIHKNSPPQTMLVHWTKQRAGVYRLDKSDEPVVQASHALMPEGGTSEDAEKLAHAQFIGDNLFVSDEENYVINAFCGPSDEWVVWVVFPTMNPTIKQLTLMWNKLMEKGINVQLHLAEAVEHPEMFMGFK